MFALIVAGFTMMCCVTCENVTLFVSGAKISSFRQFSIIWRACLVYLITTSVTLFSVPVTKGGRVRIPLLHDEKLIKYRLF